MKCNTGKQILHSFHFHPQSERCTQRRNPRIFWDLENRTREENRGGGEASLNNKGHQCLKSSEILSDQSPDQQHGSSPWFGWEDFIRDKVDSHTYTHIPCQYWQKQNNVREMVCWLPRLKDWGQTSKKKKDLREESWVLESDLWKFTCSTHAHTTHHNLRVAMDALTPNEIQAIICLKKAEAEEKNTQVPSLKERLAVIYQTFLTPLTYLCQLVPD